MVIMVFFTLLLVTRCGFVVWPSLRSLWAEEEHRPHHEPAGTAASVVAGPPRPESLEGVLVAQLAAGEITRRQYLRAMGRIAARDDERHPLAVPPEAGFDAA